MRRDVTNFTPCTSVRPLYIAPECREAIAFAAFLRYLIDNGFHISFSFILGKHGLPCRRGLVFGIRRNAHGTQQGCHHAEHAAVRRRNVYARHSVCILRTYGGGVHRLQERGAARQHRRTGHTLVRFLVRRRTGCVDGVRTDADPLRHRRADRLCKKGTGALCDGILRHLHALQLLHLRISHAPRQRVWCGLQSGGGSRHRPCDDRERQDARHGHARRDLYRLLHGVPA